MILSLGLPTLNGLSSFFPGLGIRALLVGVKLNFPDLTSLAIFSNHLLFIPSRVSSFIPFNMLPGLLFISL